MAALNFCFVLHTRKGEREEKKIVIKFEAVEKEGALTKKKSISFLFDAATFWGFVYIAHTLL